MFRAMVGFGAMGAEQASDSLSTENLSALHVAFALGYAVQPRLHLHVELATTNATSVEGFGNTNDIIGFGTAMIGPGATYYFPNNFYISGSLAASWLNRTLFDPQAEPLEDDEVNLYTEVGLGIRAVVGKEWWISDHWGAGVAIGVATAKMETWTTREFTVAASFTYD